MVATKSIKFLVVFVIALTSFTAFAQEDVVENNLVDSPDEIREYIAHHLKDSHDFHLYTDNASGTHYGFPLPVIVWTSNGLKTFMSSAFHHDDNGEVIVNKDGTQIVKYHTKIYELEKVSVNVNWPENVPSK